MLLLFPKQVMENWEREQEHYKLYNKIESMGKLSLGHDKNQKALQRKLDQSDILVIDEAHNYLHPTSKRSKAITPKGSTHVILSTATPINKKADDLLRLIELLDIDNLSDQDLATYQQLRKNRKRNVDNKHLDQLKSYVNQFIVRRTKKELNAMILREPDQYLNALGHHCKSPKTISDVYVTGETENDKKIAEQIQSFSEKLKGIHYLQTLTIPPFINRDDDKANYVRQRFKSAPALAKYMIRAKLRSSHCALVEYLHGTREANKFFELNSPKNESGDIVGKIDKYSHATPKQYIDDIFFAEDHKWLYDADKYRDVCKEEAEAYRNISMLVKQLSGERELSKAKTLIERSKEYGKIWLLILP